LYEPKLLLGERASDFQDLCAVVAVLNYLPGLSPAVGEDLFGHLAVYAMGAEADGKIFFQGQAGWPYSGTEPGLRALR
jgi:hypothetical protein